MKHKGNIMKKYSVVIILVASFMLTGCGSKDNHKASDVKKENHSVVRSNVRTHSTSSSVSSTTASVSTSTMEEYPVESSSQSVVEDYSTGNNNYPTQPSNNANMGQCPTYEEMSPEAKAEMDANYDDADGNGVPDVQETPQNEQEPPTAKPEEAKQGVDPWIQGQLDWAKEHGY